MEHTINFGEHRLIALDAEIGKNVKPDDAYGMRFVCQLGGEKPASGTIVASGRSKYQLTMNN